MRMDSSGLLKNLLALPHTFNMLNLQKESAYKSNLDKTLVAHFDILSVPILCADAL